MTARSVTLAASCHLLPTQPTAAFCGLSCLSSGFDDNWNQNPQGAVPESGRAAIGKASNKARERAVARRSSLYYLSGSLGGALPPASARRPFVTHCAANCAVPSPGGQHRSSRYKYVRTAAWPEDKKGSAWWVVFPSEGLVPGPGSVPSLRGLCQSPFPTAAAFLVSSPFQPRALHLPLSVPVCPPLSLLCRPPLTRVLDARSFTKHKIVKSPSSWSTTPTPPPVLLVVGRTCAGCLKHAVSFLRFVRIPNDEYGVLRPSYLPDRSHRGRQSLVRQSGPTVLAHLGQPFPVGF